MDFIKSIVTSASQHKQRRTLAISAPLGNLEAAIEPQRRLALTVRETAQKLTKAFDSIRDAQQDLMRGVQDYLGFDAAGLDPSTMALVGQSASFIEACNAMLGKSGLREVWSACDRVLEECERVRRSLSSLDEAHREWKHYEEKVNALSSPSSSDRDRLARNQQKLARAREAADEQREHSQAELRSFVERRVVHGRAMLRALLQTHTRLFAGCGRSAQEVAEAFDRELQPGAAVVLFGLQHMPELNGRMGRLERVEPGTGRFIVELPDGVQKAVRAENLCPVDEALRPEAVPEAAAPGLAGSAEIAAEQASQQEVPAGEEPWRQTFVDDGAAQQEAPSGEVAAQEEASEGLAAQAAQATQDGLAAEPAGGVASQHASSGRPETPPALESRRPAITFLPSVGPFDGFEAEVLVVGLEGAISEVLLGGQPVEVLVASEGRATVRIPPGLAPGLLPAEVRTERWSRSVAFGEAAFRFYRLLGFGACGVNVKLSSPSDGPPRRFPTVATRPTGLVQGVALTAFPINELPPAPLDAAEVTEPTEAGEDAADTVETGAAVPGLPEPEPARYYYEARVLDVAEKRVGRTLSIGFAWPLELLEAGSESESPRPVWVPGGPGRLPENASALPRSFIIGGDLPRAFLGGTDLGKVTGWRPLVDLAAGSVLGVLLEVREQTFRLEIFQDGTRRCAAEAALPWGWGGEPYGVVDVCGTVRSVELLQSSALPAPALAREAAAADADASATRSTDPEGG